MPYEVDPARPLSGELRRVASERLADARRHLVDPPDSFGASVHEARKRLKETRAVLRLVRPRLGRKRYRRENGRLRDAARVLGPLRDAEVASATFGGIVGSDARYDEVREALEQRLRRQRARLSRPGQLAPVVEALDDALGDLRSWPLDGGWDVIGEGLARTYRQGRDRLAAVPAIRSRDDLRADDAALHELRKAVKAHWYHLRLLRPAWPAPLRAMAGRAESVAESLGAHQDLVVLDALLASGEVPVDGAILPDFRAAVTDRQADLRASALAESRRLYAARPKVLVACLEDLWTAAQRLAGAAEPDVARPPDSGQVRRDGQAAAPSTRR